MKIIVSKRGLEVAVKNLIRVINPKSALPILGNILFDVNEQAKTVKLTASDAEVTMTNEVFLSVVEGGDTALHYEGDELAELDLAYATTIHKSQGSEYDIVVVVLMKSAGIMLQRNLLYTAVTRAKEMCLIVGQSKAIYTCIAKWRQTPRITRLKERL